MEQVDSETCFSFVSRHACVPHIMFTSISDVCFWPHTFPHVDLLVLIFQNLRFVMIAEYFVIVCADRSLTGFCYGSL